MPLCILMKTKLILEVALIYINFIKNDYKRGLFKLFYGKYYV